MYITEDYTISIVNMHKCYCFLEKQRTIVRFNPALINFEYCLLFTIPHEKNTLMAISADANVVKIINKLFVFVLYGLRFDFHVKAIDKNVSNY